MLPSSDSAKRERIAVAIFSAWFFFVPLATLAFNNASARLSLNHLPPAMEFYISIGLLGAVGGLAQALFFAFTPRKISHSLFPSLTIGFFAAVISFIVFLAQQSIHQKSFLSGVQLYTAIELLTLGLLFSYFVLAFIIRGQDALL